MENGVYWYRRNNYEKGKSKGGNIKKFPIILKSQKPWFFFAIDTTVDIIQERLSSPVGKTGDWQNHIAVRVQFFPQQFLAALLREWDNTVIEMRVKWKTMPQVYEVFEQNLVTFKLSAVQSETCQPWSRCENV